MTPTRIAEIRARCDTVARREAKSSGPGNRCYGGFEIRGSECTKCGATADDHCPVSLSDGTEAIADRADLLASHDALQAEVERLRKGLTAVAVAAAEGRVCDDVAWFDDIQTLHDFCMEAADPGGDKTAYDILTTARTDAAQRMRERCVEVCDRHGRIAAIEAASAIRALPLEES